MIDHKLLGKIIDAPTSDLVTLVRDYAQRDPKTFFRNGFWSGASLGNADVDGIDFSGADISNIDLSNAQNVEKACYRFSHRIDGPPIFATATLAVAVMDRTAAEEIGKIYEYLLDEDADFTVGDAVGVRDALGRLFEFTLPKLPGLARRTKNPNAAEKCAKGALTSLSLPLLTKVRILRDLETLSQYQIDELNKTFAEESEKFDKLGNEHPWDTVTTCFGRCQGSYMHLDALLANGLRKTKAANIIKKLRKGGGLDEVLFLAGQVFYPDADLLPTKRLQALDSLMSALAGRQGVVWKEFRELVRNLHQNPSSEIADSWKRYLRGPDFKLIEYEVREEKVLSQYMQLERGPNRSVALYAYRELINSLRKEEDADLSRELVSPLNEVLQQSEEIAALDLIADVYYASVKAGSVSDVVKLCKDIQPKLTPPQTIDALRRQVNFALIYSEALLSENALNEATNILHYAKGLIGIGLRSDHSVEVCRLNGALQRVFVAQQKYQDAVAIYFQGLASGFDENSTVESDWRSIRQNSVEAFLLVGDVKQARRLAKSLIAEHPNHEINRIIMPFLLWMSGLKVSLPKLRKNVATAPLKEKTWNFSEIDMIISSLPDERRQQAKELRNLISGKATCNNMRSKVELSK